MHKVKRSKFVLVAVVIYCLLAMYGFMPAAQAASMDSATVTLSDSDIDAIATSTIDFDMGNSNPLVGDQFVRIEYASDFRNFTSASVTCPTDTTASTTYSSDTNRVIECVVDSGLFLAATSTQQIVVENLQNPSSESATGYTVSVSSHQSNGTEIELSETKVYIIDDVTVTAHVDASLEFDVALLGPNSADNTVNGVTLTSSSTPDTLAFGTLDPTASSTMGHEFTVSTNASGGFTVSVYQDGEMTSAAGDTINSYRDAPTGQASTTPQAWYAPAATVGNVHTYGHMGLIADDTTNTGGPDFSTAKTYVGLEDDSLTQLMYHNGPANGQTTGIGTSRVAYTIDISALQEAGDYTSTLTYICTPTY